MKPDIFHIIGGGIAGLASAIAVTNAGHQAILLEKAAKFEAFGAGLQLGPNAVRALQQLGAWDAVSPITASPPEILIRNGVNGKILKRIMLGKSFEQRFGMPYRVAHRADLVQALLTVAQSKTNISIATNSEVLDHTIYKNVIAADGIWSKTRQSLFPGTAAIIMPEVFYRTLVPALVSDCITLWLYPGGHVVHYPIGNPAKLNLIAITQGQTPQIHFAKACDTLKQILAQAAEWTTWPAAYVPPLKNWNTGNVTLIGDAAHGTLPYLAQGAAMALEDAAGLAQALISEEKIDKAFHSLSQSRTERTTAVHKASLRTGKIYHLPTALAGPRNMVIQMLPSQLNLKQSEWIWLDKKNAGRG